MQSGLAQSRDIHRRNPSRWACITAAIVRARDRPLASAHAKGIGGSYQQPVEAKAPATVWNSQGAEAGAWRTFKPSDEAF